MEGMPFQDSAAPLSLLPTNLLCRLKGQISHRVPHTPASFPAVTALVGIPNGRAPVLVTPTAELLISHSGPVLTGERGVPSGGRCEGGLLHGRHYSKSRSICMA